MISRNFMKFNVMIVGLLSLSNGYCRGPVHYATPGGMYQQQYVKPVQYNNNQNAIRYNANIQNIGLKTNGNQQIYNATAVVSNTQNGNKPTQSTVQSYNQINNGNISAQLSNVLTLLNTISSQLNTIINKNATTNSQLNNTSNTTGNSYVDLAANVANGFLPGAGNYVRDIASNKDVQKQVNKIISNPSQIVETVKQGKNAINSVKNESNKKINSVVNVGKNTINKFIKFK